MYWHRIAYSVLMVPIRIYSLTPIHISTDTIHPRLPINSVKAVKLQPKIWPHSVFIHHSTRDGTDDVAITSPLSTLSMVIMLRGKVPLPHSILTMADHSNGQSAMVNSLRFPWLIISLITMQCQLSSTISSHASILITELNDFKNFSQLSCQIQITQSAVFIHKIYNASVKSLPRLKH